MASGSEVMFFFSCFNRVTALSGLQLTKESASCITRGYGLLLHARMLTKSSNKNNVLIVFIFVLVESAANVDIYSEKDSLFSEKKNL